MKRAPQPITDATVRRKESHLDLAASADVEATGVTTLLDGVHLVHNALPDLAWEDVDASTSFLGKRLSFPLIVTGMTGGTRRAARVNRDLASACESAGVAFGVGSQRAMVERPDCAATFEVRGVAPTTAVLGNIGLRAARELGPAGVLELMEAVGADGIAVHLNVGQEMIQPEGDRDFRGGVETIRGLARALGDRLVVKETGCGIAPGVAARLCSLGVRHIDVSGAGGTNWMRLEALRANGARSALGAEFSGWGVPTAACVAGAARAVAGRATLIASGGIRGGLDAARAIALGADLVGLALPVLRAQQRAGAAGVAAAIACVADGLKLAMLLTGCRTIAELRRARKMIDPRLERWICALGVSPRKASTG